MLKNPTTYLQNLQRGIANRFTFHVPTTRGRNISYLVAMMLMGLALLVRLAIAPVNAGLQYVVFFPPVTLAAVVGGYKPGLLATFIGMFFATYFFTPPYHSFAPEALQASFWPNVVFLSDGIIVSLSIEAMHRYRQEYERELKEVKEFSERVMALNKELDEFTYIASHDLKEPLRGIHNYASFLKEDHADQLNEEALQYLNSIQRLAERMTSLIDRLLAYSRLGTAEVKKMPINVDVIVDEALDNLNSLLSDGVELRRMGSLGNAEGDAVYVAEVFQNLIANAVKYNDKPAKRVEIGRDDCGANPVFYVRDNGIGIQPHHKDSVFRIFKRLHEQHKYGGGTGAGLTIVKKIIERHGGRIWIESTPGEGTTFYFTLTGEA